MPPHDPALDDCGETSFCYPEDGPGIGLTGTCRAFCEGTADDPECDADLSCALAYAGSLSLCVPSCDPLLQDCGGDDICVWHNSDFGCMAPLDETHELGEPCGAFNDCVAGSYCLIAELLDECAGSACCSAFCDLSLDPDPCAAGLACTAFFEQESAPEGFEDLGVCVAPMP